MSADQSRYYLKSLARGVDVMETLAESKEPLSLSELARAIGTNNATITRICYTLAEKGYVHRDRHLRYHLTPKTLSLGYAAVGSLNWRQVAQYYLEQLAQKTGETVNLSILEGRELMYLVRINNTGRILPFELQLGSRLPLHCTSMGKSLLAFASPDKRRTVLKDYEFTVLTHRTITNLQDFSAELQKVREKGYSVNDEELSVGLRSVSAPIMDTQGEAVASLNIAVPTSRVSLDELENRLAPLAIETAASIQQALGATDNL